MSFQAKTEGLFERSHILLEDEGIAKLQASHVLICGLGGVGGHASEALARAGVGRITLVDHDQVSPSNLNRQLVATRETIGQPKAQVMAQRIRSITLDTEVDAREQFIKPENIPALLEELQPDWVLDAIDSLNCKVGLIVEAMERQLPIVSSMGAGGRLDPTQLQVSDLMDTEGCPLAREVRKRSRRRGVGRGVRCVWSREPAKAPLPPEPVSMPGDVPGQPGRPRAVNGTISYMPSLFGLTLAGLIVQQLVQQNP
uniref:THIF-type NAD/FAD binding fold domain-containing protein n=1 Tax=Magnetococcus massalia (strain MO-1) TaxID=451514 RepID=A0A1S7LH91_MAGMO|nr:Conserved protein of unknown function. Putative UBA/THIF-type NAD/FAD binding protein [Candidatus Magnetococcus massalia]